MQCVILGKSMANRHTRRLCYEGLSLRFNKGVNFSGITGRERATHPEFMLVNRPMPPKGVCINSSALRKARGKKAYEAPTRNK